MTYHEERKMRNDLSRNSAENHAESWSHEEVSLLEECWKDVPIEEIAEALSRTIEGCRQKHYDLGKGRMRRAQEVAERSARQVNAWTRGFTSLDEMESYYER